MNDPLKYTNVIEKAVAMRVAILALERAINDPDRTLRECLLEQVDCIPEIVEEHCKGMRITWTDGGGAHRGERWGRYALELLGILVMYAGDILHGDSTPAEARENFGLHVGLRDPGIGRT